MQGCFDYFWGVILLFLIKYEREYGIKRKEKVISFQFYFWVFRAYGSLCWNLSKVIPRKDLPPFSKERELIEIVEMKSY